MLNIDKYKNDGWGLSKKCFIDIEKILSEFKKPIIVEFGSGISTTFLIDYLNENDKNGKVYSFDNDINFSSKIKDNKLILKITDLVDCSNIDYNEMFDKKKIIYDKFKLKDGLPSSRQQNCFYNITKGDLPIKIDILILDGPNGNGRNFAFLYLMNRLKTNSYVVIDDYNHYDFCEKFKYIFPNNELIYENMTGMINQWELGGNYRIYKII